MEEDESLEQAAVRELEEETGLRLTPLEQLGAFGDLGRDPRGRVITIVYYTFLPGLSHPIGVGDEASEARWFKLRALPKKMAFDHRHIVEIASQRLSMVEKTPS